MHSVRQLASEYCDAHDIYATIPALLDFIATIRSEEGELISVGCPCDITALYPLGGVEEGGFNVSMTISGLDTRRPKATGLKCFFNDEIEVAAEIISKDTVLCVAPAQANAPAMNTTSNIEGTGEVREAPN